jgi:ankyrin repeat protein
MTRTRSRKNLPEPAHANNIKARTEMEAEIYDALIYNYDHGRVRELLDIDPSLVHYRDYRGNTLLHHIAYDHGQAEMVRLLIQNGADVNAQNNYGQTPLHDASQNGVIQSMQILIDHGALVDVVDHEGMTPLMNAVVKSHENPEAAPLLLAKGAKLDLWSALWLKQYSAMREIL